MTVQTAFWDYQSSPLADPHACSPRLDSIEDYLMGRWGGQDLGCYAVRPIVGGSTPSTHGSGAAFDWRYENPGIGRFAMLEEVIPFLINNSGELGVQAIHDYAGCRIWRPPAWRADGSDGWKVQTPGSQMGQSWALWLHIEIHPSVWNDGTPVAQLLDTAPPPKPPVVFDPAHGKFANWPRNDHKKNITPGDRGDRVEYFQGVAKLRVPNFCTWWAAVAMKNAELFERDGKPLKARYCRKIARNLIAARAACRTLVVDGHYGPKSQAACIALKVAFDGRRFRGRRINFPDTFPVVGEEMWWWIDGVSDGRW